MRIGAIDYEPSKLVKEVLFDTKLYKATLQENERETQAMDN